jgi:GNAT superfamily N-acetyltransferase
MQRNQNNQFPGQARPSVLLRQLMHRIRAIGITYGAVIAFHRLVPDFLMRIRWIGVYRMDLSALGVNRRDQTVPGDTDASLVIICRRLQIRWATPEDVPRFADLDFVDTARERLAAGHHAAIAMCDGKLVGYVWFAEDQYGEDELLTEFRLPHDAMWLHAARVAAQCRRHGLYKRLLQFAFSSLRGRGVSRILFSVERLNRPSVAAHESAGAIRIGSCLIIRLLGMTACLGSWTRRGWPRLYFGTRRSPCRLSFE